MPSQTSEWPSGWQSFTPKDEDPSDIYQLELKQTIIKEYGVDNLRKSWIEVCSKLRSVTSAIAEAGRAIVPVYTLSEVLSEDNSDVLKHIRGVGCVVIRNVVLKDEANSEFKELKTFISKNKSITGWPVANPAIFHLYSTPTQLRLRTHPNQLKVQRLLNSLFLDTSCSEEEAAAQSDPMLYPDALRIRPGGMEFLGLGPHIDGGSLSRWADLEYRKTYDAILRGQPGDFDPFDITHRKNANPGMFPGGPSCSVLRTFQGWTALTSGKPGEGGLMVVPDVKLVTAYMILRPFFKQPDGDDWEDGSKWEIDESSWFPGTYRWDSQLLSPTSHPHLHLEDTLLSIPAMEPGDTIWWHADMCHAVETQHKGSQPACVVYIPSAPSTPANLSYSYQYWKDLVAGIAPEDYKYLDGHGDDLVPNEQNERLMDGALPLDLISKEGRRALGEVQLAA